MQCFSLLASFSIMFTLFSLVSFVDYMFFHSVSKSIVSCARVDSIRCVSHFTIRCWIGSETWYALPKNIRFVFAATSIIDSLFLRHAKPVFTPPHIFSGQDNVYSVYIYIYIHNLNFTADEKISWQSAPCRSHKL